MAEDVHEFDDELLSAYLDGELTDAERARVEARLEQDPAARQLLAELRDMSAALRAAPRPTVGRDLRAGVWRAVDEADSGGEPVTIPLDSVRPGRIERSRRGLIWAALATAAAIMLIVDNIDREQRRGERTVAKSAPREIPRASAPTLSTSAPAETPAPSPPPLSRPAEAIPESSVAVESAAAPAESADGRGGGYGAGYGEGRGASSATDSATSTDLGGLQSADQLVQLRLTQPRSLVRFQEVLVANSIQVENESISDGADKVELAETPAAEDKAEMAAAAPDSSPTRADTLEAAQPQFDASAAAEVDADVAAQPPSEALTDMAKEASGATAAEFEPKVQLGRARLATKSDGEQISAVLVEATPSQIAAVLDAVRSDSLNFSPQAEESLAEVGQQNDVAAKRAEQRQPQAVGRALQFNVPRGLAAQANQRQLEEVVEGVVERDRAGRQILSQLPAGEEWKMRAINTPADAEAQIRVLFLLDPAPTSAAE